MDTRTPHTRRAFTLIETLVAISIVLLALVGPLGIATRGLASALFARDQVTASYLAQGAIEYLRSVRDDNVLKGESDWLHLIRENCYSAGGTIACKIEPRRAPGNGGLAQCVGGTCPVMKYDRTVGFYNYLSGTDSPFTRTVKVTAVSGTTDQVFVTVEVSWNSGLFDQTFTIHDTLSNIWMVN